MNTDIRNKYVDELGRHKSILNSHLKKSKYISIARLAIFVLAFVMIYFFVKMESTSGVVLSIFFSIGVFIFLVRVHAKILVKKKLEESYVWINENEIKVLDGDWQNIDPGKQFDDLNHPFAKDLDVFGDGSIFQYINRSSTKSGRANLANKLMNPELQPDIIKKNQKAIEELAIDFNWRQKIQSIGLSYPDKEGDEKKVLDWVDNEPVFQSFFFKAAVFLVPIATALMITVLSLKMIPYQLFILYLTIPLGISGFTAIKTNIRYNLLSKTTELLFKNVFILKEIENKEFSAEKLKNLKEKLLKGETSAGRSLKGLHSILVALDNRLNFISWTLLNGLFLWDILQMIRLESWQKNNKELMRSWFEVIKEIDSLISLSTFAYNHPESVYP